MKYLVSTIDNRPHMYQNTEEWTAFLRKAYNDYGDLIKELNITM